MSDDRRTIGLNPQAKAALAAISESSWFVQDVVAFRIGVALALSANKRHTATGPFTTTWNVGTLDPDGTLAQLVSTLGASTERIYDDIQTLGNAGLLILAERLERDELFAIWET